ncbi:MAG: hypothetical protein ACRYFV_07090 [Janthinobacterium lividum]
MGIVVIDNAYLNMRAPKVQVEPGSEHFPPTLLKLFSSENFG